MRKQSTKNVLLKDGTAKRLPADRCEELLSTNKARRYISNTIFKAMKLGIEVKDFDTRDYDGLLKQQIKVARSKVESKKKKAAAKTKETTEE